MVIKSMIQLPRNRFAPDDTSVIAVNNKLEKKT